MRTILITGCSSGIGYDAAHAMKARGWRVLATCRAEADCERLRSEGLESFRLDYTDEASIEAAISINMGIPYFTGTQLPFIASIVIGTIQLGATVDYSILMTTRYHEERSYGRTPQEAAQQSLEHCSQSILTSGLTFFAATVGVAAISKMELLQSICRLISRGALISMAVILVVLPAALMLLGQLMQTQPQAELVRSELSLVPSVCGGAQPVGVAGADPAGFPDSHRLCRTRPPLSQRRRRGSWRSARPT